METKNIEGNCLVDPTAEIGAECKIGPNVVIGPKCKIGAGCRLKNCAIFYGTEIGNGCLISNSIISWKCNVGGWARIEDMTSIAEDVKISPEVRLSKCMVLSHKNITTNH